MIHADPINVDVGVGVQPYIPRVVSEVDVAGPSTQSQRERPVFIDIDDYDDVVVPEQPHEHMSQQPNDQMGQQPHEQMGQQIHTPRRKFFASKNVDFKKRATVNDNTTTGPASKKKTSSGEEGFDEEELDVLPESTNMDYPDIDDLPIKDDYHSSQSLSSESEPDEESDCDTNLEEEEETAEPYRYREYRKVADKYDDMYADKESEDHVPWTCETYELEIGMTWPTMKEYKTFVTRFCVANTMEITKTKDDKDRLRCRCKDPKCSFRLNGNLQKDGSTIKVTKYVPKHTCVNRDMSKKKKLDNSTWIASVIKQDVPTHTWAWSTFDLTSKCEHVTNNFTEAFNSWMLDVRCQPLHKLLEGFNLKVMGLIFERKMKFLQWEREGKILVPRAGRIMNNKISKKNRYKLFEQIEFEWCVQSRMSGSRWDVRLTEKSCSCCVWDITGIPCVHAVAVGIHLRDDMNSMVDDLQKVSSYIKAYAGKVKACASEEN
ncbi:uncharacterized protein LOC113303952 [Papaver somniferum]|uniref:uncharacterized protein LOC113303952 n=1 Tax=Papaver somniferum TaxID=3469 RepID=UPI000E702E15|nr:uncharacterized protein LOC113303952 [Papaver somniferum]XP_026408822.1 uncharacterized protein LOC113303952 [Papaver somniferum]